MILVNYDFEVDHDQIPTISCPKFQYAVMMSTRARGMVNKQSRISEIARFAMKTFRVVIIS